MLYKKSVLQLISNRYPSHHLFHVQISFDTCNTCHLKAIQGKVPCQSTVNNLCVDDESLTKLEQIIIAQWIVFEKIVVMPKGQQRKIN